MMIKVRAKILILFLALASCSAMGIIYLHYLQSNRIDRLITERETRELSTLRDYINLRGTSLATYAYDYSYWNEMIDFLKKPDSEWARLNIDLSLSTYQACAAWICDTELSVFYGASQIPGVNRIPLPITYNQSLTLEGNNKFSHFFAPTQFGIMELRGAPIQPPNDIKRTSLPQGYFFAARIWDRQMLNEIADLMGGQLYLDSRRSSIGDWRSDMTEGQIRVADTLRSWNGSAIGVIRAEIPSEFLKELRYSTAIQTILALCIMAVAMAIFWFVLYFWVSRPLRLIAESLSSFDYTPLRPILENGSEFGIISRLIKQFYEHEDGLVEEINERRRTEEALRQSEQRFRSLVESSVDWIWQFDNNMHFTYCSPKVHEIIGYTPQEMMGHTPFEYLIPGELERIRTLHGDIFTDRQRPDAVQATMYHKDGRPVLLEINGVPQFSADGKYTGYTGTARDITESRRAVEALRESEEKYRETAELLPEGIFQIDINGRLLFANRKTFEYFRALPGEDIGDVDIFNSLIPTDRDRARGYFKKIMAGEKLGAHEYTGVRKDGSTFPMAINTSPIIRDGQTVGAIGIIVDMTERRRLENHLQQTQKMEAIGKLAGGVAHDFNNLLAGVLGFIDLLKMETDPNSAIYNVALTIEKGAERSSELTRQLLGFARKGKFLTMPTDINKTIDDVVLLLKRTVDKNITLKKKLDGSRPIVLGDPGQLQQIVLNLADNACDAMPGGGTLTFETSIGDQDGNNLAPPNSENIGSWVTIKISDTGCGIPEKNRSRIFEPFFTTKGPGQGAGMGLAMVYGVVRNHGGHIECHSQEGCGTEFILHFPRHEVNLSEQPKIDTSKPQKGTGRILVVDDEPVVREVAAASLRKLGYTVAAASGGWEAIDFYRCRWSEIDLIILDMIMPGIDGRECYLALKEINPALKVILASGYGRDGKIQEVLNDGANGFVQKPFRISNLAEVVSDIMNQAVKA